MTTPTRTRRRFMVQQKAEAVELCLQEGLSCNAVAERLGLPSSSLARWVRQARIDRGQAGPCDQGLLPGINYIGGRFVSINCYLFCLSPGNTGIRPSSDLASSVRSAPAEFARMTSHRVAQGYRTTTGIRRSRRRRDRMTETTSKILLRPRRKLGPRTTTIAKVITLLSWALSSKSHHPVSSRADRRF